jgi:rod shape-determining protein MreC
VNDKRYLGAVLLVGLVVILNLPLPLSMRIRHAATDQAAPFQNVMSLLVDRVRGFARHVTRSGDAARERQEQIVEIAELRDRLRRLERLELENQSLRRQLGFAILSPRKLLLCEVVARGDLSGWWQLIRLNKGRRDGVSEGMAVMTVDGLAGRVASVSARSCDMLLITDNNCRISCTMPSTGSFGVLRGNGVSLRGDTTMELLASVNPCQLDYVPIGERIPLHAIVHTSGLGGIFPEGIPVGRVTAVELDESGLYQRALIEPVAAVDRLRYCFVVLE